MLLFIFVPLIEKNRLCFDILRILVVVARVVQVVNTTDSIESFLVDTNWDQVLEPVLVILPVVRC